MHVAGEIKSALNVVQCFRKLLRVPFINVINVSSVLNVQEKILQCQQSLICQLSRLPCRGFDKFIVQTQNDTLNSIELNKNAFVHKQNQVMYLKNSYKIELLWNFANSMKYDFLVFILYRKCYYFSIQGRKKKMH
jgi:hypothetical protein